MTRVSMMCHRYTCEWVAPVLASAEKQRISEALGFYVYEPTRTTRRCRLDRRRNHFTAPSRRIRKNNTVIWSSDRLFSNVFRIRHFT